MLYCAIWRQWCLCLSHFRTITRQTISYNQYSQPCNKVIIVFTLVSTQLMGFCSKVINYVFLHAPYEHKFCKKSIIKVILAKIKLFHYYNISTFGMVWPKMWLSLSKGAWFVRKPKVQPVMLDFIYLFLSLPSPRNAWAWILFLVYHL